MSLQPSTLAPLDDHWAESLGCPPTALRDPGVTVVAGRPEVQQLRLFVRDRSVVAVAPPGWVETLRSNGDALERFDGHDVTTLASALGVGYSRVVGPGIVYYADESTLVPVDEGGVRRLDSTDRSALATLRDACPPHEWTDRVGGFSVGAHTCLVGRFVAGALVAVAAYGVEGPVAGIAVVVHPDHRRAGHGQTVVGCVARDALDHGLVPEYRTHEAWRPSGRLARSIGFERYATTAVVVLAVSGGLGLSVREGRRTDPGSSGQDPTTPCSRSRSTSSDE